MVVVRTERVEIANIMGGEVALPDTRFHDKEGLPSTPVASVVGHNETEMNRWDVNGWVHGGSAFALGE